MGYTSYSSSNRDLRAKTQGYFTKNVDDIFEQNKKGEIHESMNPRNAKLREARDSEAHPDTVPIILSLDETGSMGKIPHDLIKNGLPTLMSSIMERGVASPSLLFIPVGDHKSDKFPLQVGQFESGDAELDTWLTRAYLEGGGGGNGGESYFLAWYFAARHTITDAWEKRKQKGFLFTIGDEPCHSHMPSNVISDLMGDRINEFHASDILKEAQEKWQVYHIHTLDGSYGRSPVEGWKRVLGENCIVVASFKDIPKTIADIVVNNTGRYVVDSTTKEPAGNKSSQEVNTNKKDEEIIL